MLKPEYIQRLPRNMVKLYEQAEADILADMARRISTYDYWIPAVEHQAKMLEEAGMVREEIIARLKSLTKRTEDELLSLMKEAGTTALKSDDEVYRRAGLKPSPISASEDLQSVLQAGFEQTNGEFISLTKTTARTATMQFEMALDRAYMQIALGGMDYNTSIRNAIKRLSADGVGAIKYPSGKVDSIEVAVRRAVVTGVNQTALKLQDARADEMGADLVEVSAHAGARPEHAVWQGGIYSRSGKSKKYPDFVKTTGYGTGAGLGGWNCSHSFRPWFEGMSRTWSKEQLADYQAKDYEYNGVKMTEYEALQEQRKIERGIRRWKREKNALEAAGLDSGEASAKVREWNRKHKDFLEQTGLKADGTRTVVGKAAKQGINDEVDIFGIAKGVVSAATGKAEGSVNEFKDSLPNVKNEYVKNLLEESIKRASFETSYKKGSYHQKGKIYLSGFAPKSTVAHELFHEIDYTHGISASGYLSTCVRADYQRLQNIAAGYGGEIQDVLYSKYPEAFRKMKNGSIVFKEDYRGISDILNGMSDGEIRLGYGHDDDYWKKPLKLEKETWAQFGRTLYDGHDEVIEVLEYICPETYWKVTQKIKELG